MSKKYWVGVSPIGAKVILSVGLGGEFNEPAREVVGVVDDLRDVGFRREEEPVVYVPIAQVQDRLNSVLRKTTPLTLAMRITPEANRAHIRNAIENVGGGVAVGRFQSMQEVLSESTARASFNTTLISLFAAFALVMAGSGIYGVVSYSVEQRTREIGIRIAVGARPAEIGELILRSAARAVLPSTFLGFICAQGLAKYMYSTIFGMATITPGVVTAVLSVFLTIAALAAYAPVRHAMRIDPSITLRN
jgi:ABC-type antimicrobial peptide transport system permease subunit